MCRNRDLIAQAVSGDRDALRSQFGQVLSLRALQDGASERQV
jgi:hypothetical protein